MIAEYIDSAAIPVANAVAVHLPVIHGDHLREIPLDPEWGVPEADAVRISMSRPPARNAEVILPVMTLVDDSSPQQVIRVPPSSNRCVRTISVTAVPSSHCLGRVRESRIEEREKKNEPHSSHRCVWIFLFVFLLLFGLIWVMPRGSD